MRDAQVQAGERNFRKFEESSEETMSVEKFFRTKPTWPPYIRAFKFQNEALPSLLGRGIDRIF
jgi:hypothetical protein